MRFLRFCNSVLVVCLLAASALYAQKMPEGSVAPGSNTSVSNPGQVQNMKLLAPGVGWVLQQNRLYLTRNNGQDWVEITPYTSTQRIESVFFLNSTSGWVIALDQHPAGRSGPALQIASTSDAGRNWTFTLIDTPGTTDLQNFASIRSMFFLDSRHGWIILRLQSSSNFSLGVLLSTDDGGVTWKERPSPPVAGSIRFLTSEEGWLAEGPSADGLWSTSDGGTSWERKTVSVPIDCGGCRVEYSLPTFEDQKNGFLSLIVHATDRPYSITYSTHDAGKSWQAGDLLEYDSPEAQSSVGSQMIRAFSSNDRTLILQYDKNSIKTTIPQTLSSGSPVWVDFADGNNGWIVWSTRICLDTPSPCSQQQELLSTTDGGITLTIITPRTASGKAGISKNIDSLTPRSTSPAGLVSEQLDSSTPVANGHGMHGLAYSQSTGPGLGVLQKGFDMYSCIDPTLMQSVWSNSSNPYRNIGVYVGGCDVHCVPPTGIDSCGSNVPACTISSNGTECTYADGNVKPVSTHLNPSDLNTVLVDWGMIPIWVGAQAPSPCGYPKSYWLIGNSPLSEGAAEADQAMARDNSLGIPGIIYYDMEYYVPGYTACSAAVASFLQGWVNELQSHGYKAGIYINTSNRADFNSMSPLPDSIWVAAWGSNATTPPTTLSAHWINQYCDDGTVASGNSCPDAIQQGSNWIDPVVGAQVDEDMVNGYVVTSGAGASLPPTVTYFNIAPTTTTVGTQLTATITGTVGSNPLVSANLLRTTDLTGNSGWSIVSSTPVSGTSVNVTLHDTPAVGTYLYGAQIWDSTECSGCAGGIGYEPSRIQVAITAATTGYFTLTNSGGISVTAGNSGTSTLTVTPVGGFSGSVSFACSVSGSPTGVSCSSPSLYASGSSGATSLLTLGTTASTPAGNYTASVTATDTATGKISAVTAISIVVTTAGTLAEPVGTTSATKTATVLVSSSFTLGSINVVTQGATALDFSPASGGTCAIGSTYTTGQSCTVNYTFTPIAPGLRMGAIVMEDSSGNVQATAYISGAGTGPQAVIYPGTQSIAVGGGLSYPRGIAIDGNGNLYVADSGNNRVLKEVVSGGNYSQSGVANSLNQPIGVAVDGAGNVYIADPFTSSVLKETPSSGSSYVQSSVGSGYNRPYGVAVDAIGNVYVADAGNNDVLKETLSGSSYIQSTVAVGLNQPVAVAVDGSGNVFIADTFNNQVLKESLSGGTYTQTTVASGLTYPQGVAIDGGGSVYISNGGATNAVVKETPSGGNYIQSVVVSSGLSPGGLVLDAYGNVYVAETYNNSLLKVDVSDTSGLNFASTVVGSTSSDSPETSTLSNIGNAVLTLAIPSSGNNPSISTNFTLNSSGGSACPLISVTASSAGTLAAGSSCALPISFVPTAGGNLTGLLALTDNSLNGTNVKQAISLSGVATSPSALAITTGAVLPSGVVGTAYSQALAATGGSGTGYSWTITSGGSSLAALGLSLSGGGAVSGSSPTAGIANFGVKVTDSAGNTAAANFAVTINAALSITTGAVLPSGVVGTAYSQALAATGGSGTGYSWTITSGGSSLTALGLSLSSGGAVSGSSPTAGIANFGVKVTDSAGNTATTNFAVTINAGLAITTGAVLPSGIVGTAYSQALVATGGSGTGYSWTITSGGSSLTALGLSLSNGGGVSGSSPTAGTANFGVKVTDSAGNTSTTNFAVTINAALSITTGAVLPSGVVGTAYLQSLTTTGGSGTGYNWTVTSGGSSLTALGLSLSSGGVVSGSSPTAGTANFGVKVTDSAGNTATTNFAVTITTPDFSITPSPTTLTVVNGSTTTADTLTVAGINGFTGTVTLACSGLPSGSVCIFAPSNSISGNGSSSLTITTIKASFVPGGPMASNRSRGWFAAAGGASLACLLLFVIPRRRPHWGALSLLILFAVASVAIGCSSSGGSTPITPSKSNTTLTLTPTTVSPTKNVSDNIMATVSPSSATGTVQFTVDGTSTGSAVGVTSGTATYPATFTTAGAHTVGASYSGDANYNSSSASPLSLNVPYTTGTIPGAYTVVVTATSGSLVHTASIALTVQ